MSTTNYASQDAKDGFEEPKTGRFQFGKVGDVITGKLVSRDTTESKFGGMATIYTVEAESGEYHPMDESGAAADKPTALVSGENYSFFGKNTCDDILAQAQIGQRVRVRFESMEKSKSNGKQYKNIRARLDNKFVPETQQVDF